MDQQQASNRHSGAEPADEGTLVVRPNLWLIPSEEIPPLLLNVEQVAACLGIGRHRVFDLIREGGIRSVKVGASRRISARALSDYVARLELEEAG